MLAFIHYLKKVPKLDKAYPKGGPSLEDAIEKFLVLSLQIQSGTSTRAYLWKRLF